MKIKAAVCHEFGHPLIVEDVLIDDPRPHEVRIKMSVCAICHSDTLYADGAWGGALPAVYGHEGAGIVDAVGDGVNAVARGDSVIVSLVRSCGECFYCRKNQHNLCNGTFSTD